MDLLSHMTQHTKKGREYEHRLASTVVDRADGAVVAFGSGYNAHDTSAVDMAIDDGQVMHCFELKTTSKDAYTLNWNSEDAREDDLYELIKFCKQYPRPAYPYAGVNFNRRQLTLTRFWLDDWPDKNETLDRATELAETDVRHDTGRVNDDSLRFYKPDLDGWPSATSGDDAQYVLDTIGFQY
jgi:Holliday junction resolvase